MKNPPTTRFHNRKALVTGGGSGIGQAIALRLAEEGAHVVILDTNRADETVAQIEAFGGKVQTHVGDVTDPDSVHRVVSGLDRLDVLVNNAGIAHVGTVLTTSPDDLDRVYRVNVRGV